MAWFPCGCDDLPPDPTPTCLISLGWACDVKNGIVSDDLTRWAVDAGTWNATQLWLTGTSADTLTTSSSDARISCDTQQSLPLDDQMRVRHWVKVTHANDEAVILLAGYKVVLKSGSVEIRSGATVIDSLTTQGIGLNAVASVHVCTWHDSDVGRDYLGVSWSVGFIAKGLVAEVTLGTDGTTEFGTDSVTGAVSFHRVNSTPAYTPGEFAHNTIRTDGSDLDCATCHFIECQNCPGGEAPSYLTVAMDGLTGRTIGYATQCETCAALNGSYVIDMTTSGYPAGCQGTTPNLAACVPSSWVSWTISIAASITAITGGWRLTVYVTELSDHPPHHHATQSAAFIKDYTSAKGCSEINDYLELDWYVPQVGEEGCGNLSDLSIHVTAV